MHPPRNEWNEIHWNPTTGCTTASSGCRFCYARALALHVNTESTAHHQDPFMVTQHEDVLDEPYTWNDSKLVMVSPLGDLFHPFLSTTFILKVFEVMNANPQHLFVISTKRTSQMMRYDAARILRWTPNIFVGASVENEDAMHRVESLRNTKAPNKFLAFEPLTGPIPKLNLRKVDWVMVGGENCTTPRHMEEEWVLDIKDQCERASLPFYFKQWSGNTKHEAGRILQGRTWDEMPVFLEEFLKQRK